MRTETQSRRLLFVLILWLSLSLACGLLTGNGERATPNVDVGQPVGAEATPTMGVEQPGGAETPVPTVIHLTSPGEPSARYAFLTDADSSGGASSNQALTGDDFDLNRFERPFTAEEMAYRPDLDILRAEVAFDGDWMYFTLEVQGPHPEAGGFPALYAAEVDLDTDGDGDWLIVASALTAGDWTVAGVRAYYDANDDVGGAQPLRADRTGKASDGYEEEVFDQGQGADPDAAWARLASGEANTVQIAVKHSLLDNDPAFLWVVWADDGDTLPALMDVNDHFTVTEAGSPLAASSDYPLKAVAIIDNTCRMPFGFNATGFERGLCPGAAVSQPTPTPTAAGLPDLVCLSLSHDGTYDTDTHTFTYTIANQGQAPVAAGFNMIFRIINPDNSTSSAGPFSGPALDPGESYTGQYAVSGLSAANSGNYQYSFVLDGIAAIAESNENNNQCVINFKVIKYVPT